MFLVARPDHDLITNYLYHWSMELIEEAEKHNIEVIDIQGKKVNPKEVSSRLKKLKPLIVLLNGHGNQELVTGYDNLPIVTMENVGILAGALVYSRSCSSGAKLGPLAIKQGTKGFIGYKESFVMCFDKDKIQKPLEDEVASHFLEPSNQVVRSLLKGHSISEASMRSKDVSRKKMQKLLVSGATNEEMLYAKYIWHNMRSQVCLGQLDAAM